MTTWILFKLLAAGALLILLLLVWMARREKRREAVILEILNSDELAELTGRHLINRSNGLLSRGTVYVTLTRMEEAGLLTSRKISADGIRVYKTRVI